MVEPKKKGPEFVLKNVRDRKVRLIRLWFTDILGFLKSFTITADELEMALEEGVGFDGSSIEGFARIDESDMIAKPDPATFQSLPWSNDIEGGEVRMFCDILHPGGDPFEGDPRWVLKRALERAAQLGYTFYVGPELEFFYFKNQKGMPEPIDEGGYFDLVPQDVADQMRRETVLTLEAMGIGVEYAHHEVAPSQQEVDLRFTDALTMADNAMTYRMIVREVATRHGIHATFMPKPLFGENGSGMHTHQSLFVGERNAFFDPDDEHHLSSIARQYIAGLLRHAREFTLVTNQWVNSYKRLVPGFEAPIYLTWALRNRSDLIRVPAYKPGKERSTRVEYRAPDAACNPYLAFAVMLAAGLEGVINEYEPVEPTEENVYLMGERERAERGISTLPEDLHEAISVAEKSELVRKTLGEHVFEKFLANKRIEWQNYRSRVHSYEIERYMSIL
jgi:glutamine synthetase